jgi:hypothetical protein
MTMIQTKFGFHWSSTLRGEDFWKSLRRTTDDDDGRQVMAIALLTLWKKTVSNDRIWLPILELLPFLAHLAFKPCELLSSLFVRRSSSHFNLLLRNHWTNCDQTLVEWSLDGPLSKLWIQTKFGFHWSSTLRGEDFWKSLRHTTDDDDGRQVMAIAHLTLSKIYLPCNFEVNLITHLGVIALFSSPGLQAMWAIVITFRSSFVITF